MKTEFFPEERILFALLNNLIYKAEENRFKIHCINLTPKDIDTVSVYGSRIGARVDSIKPNSYQGIPIKESDRTSISIYLD